MLSYPLHVLTAAHISSNYRLLSSAKTAGVALFDRKVEAHCCLRTERQKVLMLSHTHLGHSWDTLQVRGGTPRVDQTDS